MTRRDNITKNNKKQHTTRQTTTHNTRRSKTQNNTPRRHDKTTTRSRQIQARQTDKQQQSANSSQTAISWRSSYANGKKGKKWQKEVAALQQAQFATNFSLGVTWRASKKHQDWEMANKTTRERPHLVGQAAEGTILTLTFTFTLTP
jgi:hypothetical protein